MPQSLVKNLIHLVYSTKHRNRWIEERVRDALYAYQAGIDPECLDEEPGRMMAAAMIQRAIADGQQAFDFLRGDEPYKRQWRAEPRPLAPWCVVPQRALPQLRHSVWLAGDAMKTWLRQRRGVAARHGAFTNG